MRMTGFASGMDVEQIVGDLMEAERQPLQKMEQDQNWLTLQRDAYREVNTKLSEFDNMFLDMRMSTTYQQSEANSSQPDAVSASVSSDADEGNYKIDVDELASTALNHSVGAITDDEDFDPDDVLEDLNFNNPIEGDSFVFSTFNEDGSEEEHKVEFDPSTDSLNDVLDKISDESGGRVRGFYDENMKQVFLETTRTGSYNNTDEYLGAEIGFNGETDSAFLTNTLQIKNGVQGDNGWEKREIGGTDAEFSYNGIEMTSRDNEYEANGVTFEFNDTTESPASISVKNDVDGAVEKITEFVDKYNEMIEFLNEKTTEERHRDYPPLTEAQRQEMSESEIELWEERSNSGLLRSDNIIQSGLSSMRTAWYSSVENEVNEDYQSVLDVGITTSSNWRDGGKLEVDEDQLRSALQDDSEAVFRLFSRNEDDETRGVVNRVEDSVSNMMDRITDRAGNELRTEHQYTMGRELLSMSDRMQNFERRMQQTEQRYWDQFNRMEQAVQEMNNQSQQMQQQLGQMG